MKSPRKAAPVQVAAALRGFRFNAYTLTVLAVMIFGVVTLAPRVQTWFVQRQQIAEAQASLEQAKKDVISMQEERKRWEDPVYIRAQARNRLYYVMPGEVSYLVMDAAGIDTSDKSGTVGAMLADRANTSEISTTIRETKNNWVDSVMESVIRAGVEQPEDAQKVSAAK